MDSSSPSEKTPPVELVDSSRFLHGRLDPGREENYGLVEALDVQPQVKATEMRSQWAFDEGSPSSRSLLHACTCLIYLLRTTSLRALLTCAPQLALPRRTASTGSSPSRPRSSTTSSPS